MEALSAYLERTGKTAVDLARELKQGVTTVHYWANGKRKPGIKAARRLARHTGIPLSRIRPDIWGRG